MKSLPAYGVSVSSINPGRSFFYPILPDPLPPPTRTHAFTNPTPICPIPQLYPLICQKRPAVLPSQSLLFLYSQSHFSLKISLNPFYVFFPSFPFFKSFLPEVTSHSKPSFFQNFPFSFPPLPKFSLSLFYIIFTYNIPLYPLPLLSFSLPSSSHTLFGDS